MIKWFMSLLLLICCITFNDLYILNHSCIPGWSQLCHGVWSFQYTVEFGLPNSFLLLLCPCPVLVWV
jgi:hypothetical protein